MAEHVQISGIETPVFPVGYGTYHLLDKLDPLQALDSFGHSFGAGVNFYDTSDNYGTELILGRAVAEGVLPRDEVVIATKTGIARTWYDADKRHKQGVKYEASAETITSQAEKSLRILGDDVGIIDVYQLHAVDPAADPLEQAAAMQKLIDREIIRAWGVSNYDVASLRGLFSACDKEGLTPPATSQPFLNVIEEKEDIEPVEIARRRGMTILAHSPLFKGGLSDETFNVVFQQVGEELNTEELKARMDADSDFKTRIMILMNGLLKLKNLKDFAKSQELTLSQMSLGWLLAQPGTVALNSLTRPEYIADAAIAAEAHMSEEMLAGIKRFRNQPLFDEFSSFYFDVASGLHPYYNK